MCALQTHAAFFKSLSDFINPVSWFNPSQQLSTTQPLAYSHIPSGMGERTGLNERTQQKLAPWNRKSPGGINITFLEQDDLQTRSLASWCSHRDRLEVKSESGMSECLLHLWIFPLMPKRGHQWVWLGHHCSLGWLSWQGWEMLLTDEDFDSSDLIVW